MATARSDRPPAFAQSDERVENAIRELEEVLADKAEEPHTRAALETLREALNVAHTRASQDPLTGLMNRASFDPLLESTLQRAAETGGEVALLFLDLDGFKKVNDQRGHAAGDRLLREVAARIMGCMREDDLLARYGGDEFVVAVEGAGDPQIVDTVATRILQCLSGTFTLDGSHVSLSVSIGVALFPRHASSAAELVMRADEAMYQAKRQGGDRYCRFQRALQADHSGSYAKFETSQRSTSDVDIPLRRA